MNNHCTEFCRATSICLRRFRHREDYLPGKGVLTIRMLEVREEFVPKLDASAGATGTAHEPQAREQSRRALRLNLRRLRDRPGTAPTAGSPADNGRGETGQHDEDDKRLIALEQIFVCHTIRIGPFLAAAQRSLILELNARKSTGESMRI